jgi:methyltransferase (TIGR00027 family)
VSPRVQPGAVGSVPAPGRAPSSTSLSAATLRAAHLLIDEPPPILDDRVALRLLGADAAERIRAAAERFRAPSARLLRTEIVVRSQFAEDALENAARRGICQYVILGAGLDTFAYRQQAWTTGLRIVEVDHPASQRDKRQRLERAGIAVPSNVAYVAADLETDPLADSLRAGGLDPSRPAFVACLGVLIYLTEAAVGTVFEAVGTMPHGSEFVFTFSRPAGSDGPDRRSSTAARVAARGEPWITRFEPRTLEDRLTVAGFSSVDLVGPEEIEARYLAGRTDGLRQPPRAWIAHARV